MAGGTGEKADRRHRSSGWERRILAEDLGVLHESVRRLLQATGYPGMKVLLFAFDSGAGNTHLPHWFERNAAVYGGTHDNETIAGYCAGKTDEELRYLMDYLQAARRADIPACPAACRLSERGGRGDFQMRTFWSWTTRPG